MSDALLAVQHLDVLRGSLYLCQDWQMQLEPGECVHLAGPNGCGKTSFFQVITGLLRPAEGTVTWQGHELWQVGDKLRVLWHYLTHQHGLKDAFTVYENVHMLARLAALPGIAPSEQHLLEVIEAMQLSFLVDTPVRYLSQGQQRRTALTRLMAVTRPVWLLDEPFNALDEVGREQLAQWINGHCQRGGAVLFTSHFAWPCQLQVHRRLEFGVADAA